MKIKCLNACKCQRCSWNKLTQSTKGHCIYHQAEVKGVTIDVQTSSIRWEKMKKKFKIKEIYFHLRCDGTDIIVGSFRVNLLTDLGDAENSLTW